MRQNGARAGLAAQDFNSGIDDGALHANLARANLMRLRGDFQEAEKVCVSLLAAYPENAQVHTLLGDIAFSQDETEKAIEHYEIAQQLDDKAPDIPRKLAEARSNHDTHETVTTAVQLGLPTKAPLPWASIGFGAIAALALGGALIAGLTANTKNAAGPQVAPAIVATSDTVAKNGTAKDATAAPTDAEKQKDTATTGTTTPPATTTAPIVTPSQPVVGTLDDQTLLAQIQGHGTEGSHLLALASDPRTHQATLTYSVPPGDDARHLGAELAKSTLDVSGDTLLVTLRGVRDQKLVYVADMPRTLYADTITEAWKTGNPEADSWVAHSLTNEWPLRSSDTAQKAP